MERTAAVELVASTIARYPHVTHLRLTTRGSFSGRSRIEVMTLGPSGGKRPKGTREQEYIGFEGDMFARPGDLPVSTWFEVFEALDPDIYFAGGCAEQTGFDVDAEGNITNRRGSKTQAVKAERKRQADLARMDAELDAELTTHATDANEAQRLARIVRGGFDPTLLIYPVRDQQAGRVDRLVHDELLRKASAHAERAVAMHDALEDADKTHGLTMRIDLDDVVYTGYAEFLEKFVAAPERASLKHALLEDMLTETGTPAAIRDDRLENDTK